MSESALKIKEPEPGDQPLGELSPGGGRALFGLIYFAIYSAFGPPLPPGVPKTVKIYLDRLAEKGRPITPPEEPGRKKGGGDVISTGAAEWAKIKAFEISLEKWLGKRGGKSMLFLLCLIYLFWQLYTIWGIKEEMMGAVMVVKGELENMQGDIREKVRASLHKNTNLAVGNIVDEINEYGISTRLNLDADDEEPHDGDEFSKLKQSITEVLAIRGEGDGMQIWSEWDTVEAAISAEDSHLPGIFEGLGYAAILLTDGQEGLDKIQADLLTSTNHILRDINLDLEKVFGEYSDSIKSLGSVALAEAGGHTFSWIKDYFNTFTPYERSTERLDRLQVLVFDVMPREYSDATHRISADLQMFIKHKFITLRAQMMIILACAKLLLTSALGLLPALHKLLELSKDKDVFEEAFEKLRDVDKRRKSLEEHRRVQERAMETAHIMLQIADQMDDSESGSPDPRAISSPRTPSPRTRRKKKPKKKSKSKPKKKPKKSKKKPKKKKRPRKKGRTERR